jgi:hypothetical protein
VDFEERKVARLMLSADCFASGRERRHHGGDRDDAVLRQSLRDPADTGYVRITVGPRVPELGRQHAADGIPIKHLDPPSLGVQSFGQRRCERGFACTRQAGQPHGGAGGQLDVRCHQVLRELGQEVRERTSRLSRIRFSRLVTRPGMGGDDYSGSRSFTKDDTPR